MQMYSEHVCVSVCGILNLLEIGHYAKQLVAVFVLGLYGQSLQKICPSCTYHGILISDEILIGFASSRTHLVVSTLITST